MKRKILLFTILILALSCNQTRVNTGEKKHGKKLNISKNIPVQKIDSINIHYVRFRITTITNLKCNELDSRYEDVYFFRHITNKDVIKDLFNFLDRAELFEKNIDINKTDARVKMIIYTRDNITDSLCVTSSGDIIYKSNLYGSPDRKKYRADVSSIKYFKNLVGD